MNKNINQSSKYGPVDIMLYNNTNNHYICFSCKFFENESCKYINDYDVDKMFCEMNCVNVEYGLLVKDKHIGDFATIWHSAIATCKTSDITPGVSDLLIKKDENEIVWF